MKREPEKLGSPYDGDLQTVEGSNDSNRSGSSNNYNHPDRYGTTVPVNSNFVNLVSAVGLPPSSGRTAVPPPPSYVSDVQPPYIQPPHIQLLQPNMNESMESIPPPLVGRSGPVDALWLLDYAGGWRGRENERTRETGLQ
jgi:hypothetical protein